MIRRGPNKRVRCSPHTTSCCHRIPSGSRNAVCRSTIRSHLPSFHHNYRNQPHTRCMSSLPFHRHPRTPDRRRNHSKIPDAGKSSYRTSYDSCHPDTQTQANNSHNHCDWMLQCCRPLRQVCILPNHKPHSHRNIPKDCLHTADSLNTLLRHPKHTKLRKTPSKPQIYVPSAFVFSINQHTSTYLKCRFRLAKKTGHFNDNDQMPISISRIHFPGVTLALPPG